MLRLRKAVEEDSKLIFEWANDPVTRANSIATEPIPWQDHERWFASKRADPNADLFVAEERGEPVGVVRLDRDGESAEISINIAPHARGRGLGTAIIDLGVLEFFGERRGELVVAYVKPANAASVRAFLKAKFLAAGLETVRDSEMLRLERRPVGWTVR